MKIEGSLSIVGDKSLSHRAIILCSLASGVSRIKNILLSGDTKATIQIFRQLGVEINEINNNEIEVHGVGLHGLRQPDGPLDAINSGTTARLLTGLLSKQNFKSRLTGSTQLIKRPMKRIVKPLLKTGAIFDNPNNDNLPIKIRGTKIPIPIEYFSSVASAQIKSSII